MLRLETKRERPGEVTVLVEGKMVSDWLELLEEELRNVTRSDELVVLDLSGVTYVGPPGVKLLKRLVGAGARLTRVPGLIAQMLDLEE